MLTNETFFDPKAIAKNLVKLREKKGESQREVAEAIGVAPSTYSMYENGERVPRDKTKMRIAKHFKTPVHKIFFS